MLRRLGASPISLASPFNLENILTSSITPLIPAKRKSSPQSSESTPVFEHHPQSEPAANSDSISCICGFTFDDGFSIACDDCERWSHAACFEIVEGGVPEEWRCWRCVPRPVDRERAYRLQRGRLDEAAGLEKGRRRNSPGVERKPRRASAAAIDGGGGGKRKRRASIIASSTPTSAHFGNTPVLCEDEHVDIDEPWTHSYVPIAQDIIPHQETRDKLRRQAQHWRGITALCPTNPTSSPTTPVRLDTPLPNSHHSPTTLHPLPNAAFSHPTLSLNTNPAVRPPSYSLHTTTPIPAARLITPFPSTIIPSATYLADPLNAYAHLGLPKPFVHLVGPPLDLTLDARTTGAAARFVRSGCHPNAVLRPVLCPPPSEMLRFAVFALRDLKKDEEVVLGWEWDDGNAVHALPALIQAPHLLPDLRNHLAIILHALGSTFTTCACGARAKDCALTQMAAVLDGEEIVGEDGKVDLGPLVGVRRGFATREKVPWSSGLGGMEMLNHPDSSFDEDEDPSQVAESSTRASRRSGRKKVKRRSGAVAEEGEENVDVVKEDVVPPKMRRRMVKPSVAVANDGRTVGGSSVASTSAAAVNGTTSSRKKKRTIGLGIRLNNVEGEAMDIDAELTPTGATIRVSEENGDVGLEGGHRNWRGEGSQPQPGRSARPDDTAMMPPPPLPNSALFSFRDDPHHHSPLSQPHISQPRRQTTLDSSGGTRSQTFPNGFSTPLQLDSKLRSVPSKALNLKPSNSLLHPSSPLSLHPQMPSPSASFAKLSLTSPALNHLGTPSFIIDSSSFSGPSVHATTANVDDAAPSSENGAVDGERKLDREGEVVAGLGEQAESPQSPVREWTYMKRVSEGLVNGDAGEQKKEKEKEAEGTMKDNEDRGEMVVDEEGPGQEVHDDAQTPVKEGRRDEPMEGIGAEQTLSTPSPESQSPINQPSPTPVPEQASAADPERQPTPSIEQPEDVQPLTLNQPVAEPPLPTFRMSSLASILNPIMPASSIPAPALPTSPSPPPDREPSPDMEPMLVEEPSPARVSPPRETSPPPAREESPSASHPALAPPPPPRAPTPPPQKVKMSLKDFAMRKKKKREEEMATTRVSGEEVDGERARGGDAGIEPHAERSALLNGSVEVKMGPNAGVSLDSEKNSADGMSMDEASHEKGILDQNHGTTPRRCQSPHDQRARTPEGQANGLSDNGPASGSTGPSSAVNTSSKRADPLPSPSRDRSPLPDPTESAEERMSPSRQGSAPRSSEPFLNGNASRQAKIELIEAGLPNDHLESAPTFNIPQDDKHRNLANSSAPSTVSEAGPSNRVHTAAETNQILSLSPERPPSPLGEDEKSLVIVIPKNTPAPRPSTATPSPGAFSRLHSRRPSQEDGEIRSPPPKPKPQPQPFTPFVPRSHTPPTQPRSFHLAPPSPNTASHSICPPNPQSKRTSHPPFRPALNANARPLPSGPRALRNGNGQGQSYQNQPSPHHHPARQGFGGSQFIPRGPSADRDRVEWERERGWPRTRGRGGANGWR